MKEAVGRSLAQQPSARTPLVLEGRLLACAIECLLCSQVASNLGQSVTGKRRFVAGLGTELTCAVVNGKRSASCRAQVASNLGYPFGRVGSGKCHATRGTPQRAFPTAR